MTQKEQILPYYEARPGQAIKNSEVNAWVRANKPEIEHPGRVIRLLKDDGKLQMVGRGIYKLK